MKKNKTTETSLTSATIAPPTIKIKAPSEPRFRNTVWGYGHQTGIPAAIYFSPLAWLKMLRIRDKSEDEVFAYCISKDATWDGLLDIVDVCFVKQIVTPVSWEVDGNTIGEFLEEQVIGHGLTPAQCCTVGIHTHPGSGTNSANPSDTDERNFATVHGKHPMAAMVILSRGGETYCRVRRRCEDGGPDVQSVIPVKVRWEQLSDFMGSLDAAMQEADMQFDLNVESAWSFDQEYRQSDGSYLATIYDNGV